MSKRQNILEKLRLYSPNNPTEQTYKAQMIQFIENTPHCFERQKTGGNITSSAWIVNKDFTKAFLILHKKFKEWIQPGGHCDGNSNLLEVAKKELIEETGLNAIPYHANLFDIGVHNSICQKTMPNITFYDFRFLFVVSSETDFTPNNEGIQTKWMDIKDIINTSTNESVLRMAEKTLTI